MIYPGVYAHFKGGRYTVIANAVDSTNDWYRDDGQTREASHAPVVIYLAHDHPERLCVRSEAEWSEVVTWPDGKQRSRFERAVRLEGGG